MDLKKVSESVRYFFKDDSTQRIFRMDESEIEFQDTGSSDSEDDDLEVIRDENDGSEVRLQKGLGVFEKSHYSVVGHLDAIAHIRLSNFLDINGSE